MSEVKLNEFNASGDIFTVQFTRQELWVIIRALAVANSASADSDGSKSTDESVRTWVADRLLRKIEESPSDERTWLPAIEAKPSKRR